MYLNGIVASMADPLSPDTIAQRTFRRRLRGFDPQEVGTFLEEVAASARELESRLEALENRLLELGNRDLTAEFDRVGEDVGRILQDARQAADGMRKRAAADAGVVLEEARASAVDLRSDAWMAAEKLLLDSTKEAAGIVEAAERESLAIIGEAERETHRRQSALRRESEETIRATKHEAERVLMDARARSDELIQEAERKVATAESRAAAVEERRTEMLEELENARQTISNLEAEIGKRREALAGPLPTDVESSTVRLLTGSDREAADTDEETVWAEGTEVVKIVRPPERRAELPAEPVDAEAMAAEVARLRTPSEEDEADEARAPEPAAEPREAAVSPRIAESPPPAATTRPTAEIDNLFARLRRVGEGTPSVEAASLEVEEPPGGQPEPSAPTADSSDEADPFDLRDRLLLPVANRALRTVKRELTEAQNIALEELRVESDEWEPRAAALTDRLVGSVAELLRDGYAAGWAAAAEATGTEPAVEGDRQGDAAEWAGTLSETFTSAVAEALAESRRDGHGPRQLAADLSRVFRSWRTDEAERRVRDIASGAYHRGLIDGFGTVGVPASRWVTAGRGCTTCREAAEAGAVPLGSAFEAVGTEPPAHPDCGCTLVSA